MTTDPPAADPDANIALVARAFAALADGDVEAIRECLADGCHYRVGGRSAISGTYVGSEEVLGLARRLRELTDDTYDPTVHDVLANDVHTIALVNVEAERGGSAIAYDVIHVAHIEDGLIHEVWAYPTDPYRSDPFWGPPPEDAPEIT